MSSCVIPGSFDPVTIGHVSLIRQAAGLFDRVTVTVMVNIHKQSTISAKERCRFLERSLEDIPNVRVMQWDGLLVDFMRKNGEKCIVRGCRSGSEFDSESASAAINRLLYPEISYVLIPAEDSLSCVSSSAVREIIAFGGDPKPFLPPDSAEEIVRALSKEK